MTEIILSTGNRPDHSPFLSTFPSLPVESRCQIVGHRDVGALLLIGGLFFQTYQKVLTEGQVGPWYFWNGSADPWPDPGLPKPLQSGRCPYCSCRSLWRWYCSYSFFHLPPHENILYFYLPTSPWCSWSVVSTLPLYPRLVRKYVRAAWYAI